MSGDQLPRQEQSGLILPLRKIAAIGAVFLAGYGTGVVINGDADDRPRLEASCDVLDHYAAPLEVVEHERMDFEDTLTFADETVPASMRRYLRPFNKLLPQERQINDVFYAISSKTCATAKGADLYGGNVDLGTPGQRHIYMEAAHDMAMPKRFAKLFFSHEATHVLIDEMQKRGDSDTFTGINSVYIDLLNDKKPGLGDQVQAMRAEGQTLTQTEEHINIELPNNPDGLTLESDGSVFSIFDESSYSKMHAGHPYGSPGELIASSVTVMHVFPESFLLNLDRLDPERQALATSTARDVLRLLYTFSVDYPAVTQLFPQQLLDRMGFTQDYLKTIGATEDSRSQK